MLKQRILTALILGPLVIWSVIAFNHTLLAIEMGLVLLLAAWEWARISGLHAQSTRIGFSIFTAFLLLLLTWLMHFNSNWLQPALYIFSGLWLCAALLIVRANQAEIVMVNKYTFGMVLQNLIVGCLVLSGAFIAVVGMHRAAEYGAVYILILLILIWVADSAAYFTGKAFGRHKLAVHVSPGKTWEGVAGGITVAAIAAYIIGIYLDLESPQKFLFVAITIITVIFSIIGDLMVSLFKRRAGVKDSSQLLPGHGGILDRIDSLLSSSPVFLLGLLVAGIK